MKSRDVQLNKIYQVVRASLLSDSIEECRWSSCYDFDNEDERPLGVLVLLSPRNSSEVFNDLGLYGAKSKSQLYEEYDFEVKSNVEIGFSTSNKFIIKE
ncbi:hypothetical protein RHGRI_017131 [Rhododendron griersonianum]|uniref:Uncharacterized protein n=1 Tax=Rhododendron griersonianum TaxID=479676 RepID=A0AAV6JWQ0_9ERIC|nr:hypothetical protein RHGRI_017131 [Rhododendron griersonianum]